MRFVLRVIAGLILVVVVLAAASFLLPREVTVTRSIKIDAPAETIFPYVNSMKKTEEWSPWLARDPRVTLIYSGPDEGVGSTLEWASDEPDVGTGTQKITLSKEFERVETALDFGPMGTATAYFALLGGDPSTDVTWGLITDNGMNPMARWMGLMLDTWVGGDYEKGLENLKTLVEGG